MSLLHVNVQWPVLKFVFLQVSDQKFAYLKAAGKHNKLMTEAKELKGTLIYWNFLLSNSILARGI